MGFGGPILYWCFGRRKVSEYRFKVFSGSRLLQVLRSLEVLGFGIEMIELKGFKVLSMQFDGLCWHPRACRMRYLARSRQTEANATVIHDRVTDRPIQTKRTKANPLSCRPITQRGRSSGKSDMRSSEG